MGWVGGLAEWEDENVTYLSVAFTYKLNQAYERAQAARFLGRKVVIGGPALFLVKMQHVVSFGCVPPLETVDKQRWRSVAVRL